MTKHQGKVDVKQKKYNRSKGTTYKPQVEKSWTHRLKEAFWLIVTVAIPIIFIVGAIACPFVVNFTDTFIDSIVTQLFGVLGFVLHEDFIINSNSSTDSVHTVIEAFSNSTLLFTAFVEMYKKAGHEKTLLKVAHGAKESLQKYVVSVKYLALLLVIWLACLSMILGALMHISTSGSTFTLITIIFTIWTTHPFRSIEEMDEIDEAKRRGKTLR